MSVCVSSQGVTNPSQTHEGLVEQNWPLGKKTLTLLASGLLTDTLTVPAVRAQVTAVERPLPSLRGASVELHGMRAAGEALSAVAVGIEEPAKEGVEDALAPGDSVRLGVGEEEMETVGEGVGDALAPGDSVVLGVGEGELESVGPLKLLENCTLVHAAWLFRAQPMIVQHGSRLHGTLKRPNCSSVVSLRYMV